MNTINTKSEAPKKGFSRNFLIPLSIFSILSLGSIFNNAKATEKCRDDLCDLLKIKPKIVQANPKDLPKDVSSIMEYFAIESGIEWVEDKDIIDVIKEYIDKDKVAEEYLKHNLFINWKLIINKEFDYSFKKIEEDLYQITYSHKLEWIPNYAEDMEVEVVADIKFLYENNNIYIQFVNVKLWGQNLEDGWHSRIGDVMYDFDMNEKTWGHNKSIEINSKVNPHKTLDMIHNKIKGYQFSISKKMELIEEFENTQLLKLNEISLWEEIMKEWEFYYREMFLVEKWKYRPMGKIYFDKYGDLDQQKTEEELEKNKNVVLWVTIDFDNFNVKYDLGTQITPKKNWKKGERDTTYVVKKDIGLSISDQSKIALEDKVRADRARLINVLNSAEVGSNTGFPWLNKIHKERPWSNKKEWSFDTGLLGLEIVGDRYDFNRWNKQVWNKKQNCNKGQAWDKEQVLYFGVTKTKEGENNLRLVNADNQKVNGYFTPIINNGYYQFVLDTWNDALKIYKMNEAGINIESRLPAFSWNKTLTDILNAKDINTYYNTDTKNLEYRTNEWKLITSIPCTKTEKWEYKLEKTSTNINTEDLYNYPDFKKNTDGIRKIQKELNILDIDISNSFEILLMQEWVDLDNQELIKIVDQAWVVHYCTIKQTRDWMYVDLDKKLYKSVGKALNTLNSRLKIVEEVNDIKIRWKDKWKEEDFTQFIYWKWGTWTKPISQDNIIKFISKSTDELEVVIVWWEWEETIITFKESLLGKLKKEPWLGKMKLLKPKRERISWQDYKTQMNKEGWIYIDPKEIKQR